MFRDLAITALINESEDDKTLSADDLKRMGIIDDKIVHWLATNKLSEDIALLLLEYVDYFTDNQKADLTAELIRLGGDQLSPTVFSFAKMDDIYIAHSAMIASRNFDHLFFHCRAAELGTYGGRQNQL
uniref:Uncharacterized protein n=1 Tax=Panagrolaimus davidi TaxID=227884 RepID=A0A914P1W6_9BILA